MDEGRTHFVGDDCPGGHRDLDDALSLTQPQDESAVTVAPARRQHRHQWEPWSDTPGESWYRCMRCRAVRDDARSRRGRTARNRGNAFERDVAKRLGISRVGQYGGSEDAGKASEWMTVQCKVGTYYPERIDGWLRALPTNAGQLRAVVIGDSPGGGRRRRSLIVLDLDDFVSWFGKDEEDAA